MEFTWESRAMNIWIQVQNFVVWVKVCVVYSITSKKEMFKTLIKKNYPNFKPDTQFQCYQNDLQPKPFVLINMWTSKSSKISELNSSLHKYKTKIWTWILNWMKRYKKVLFSFASFEIQAICSKNKRNFSYDLISL